MTIALAAAAWLSGGILLASGILKLGRTDAFHESLPHLGVPAWLRRTRWFAALFPFAEIAVGIGALVLPPNWHRLPLVAAAALFAVFLVVSIRASRRPEEVDCECFGGLGDARMTRVTVVRNAAFLTVGAIGVLAPRSPTTVAADLELPSFLPLLLTILTIGVLVIRRNTTSKSTTSDSVPAPVGAPNPEDAALVLFTADGESIALDEYRTPPTHLVFFSPDCGSCHTLVARFRWWPHGLPEGDDLQPVFLGSPEDFADYEVYAPLAPHALYDPNRITARALGLRGTPGHAYIDAEHPLGSGWSAGETAIEAAVLRPGFFEEHESGVRPSD